MTEPAPEPAPGKGRPTPKRRDAEQRRRTPVTAPKTRREANRRLRETSKQARGRARSALRSGDPRYLPVRDAGPVKSHVRDVVDARRNAASYLLFAAGAVFLLNLVPAQVVRAMILVAYPVVLIWVVLDTALLVRVVRRSVRERFPGEPVRGVASYGVIRSFQLRRFRLPPPKVKVGTRV